MLSPDVRQEGIKSPALSAIPAGENSLLRIEFKIPSIIATVPTISESDFISQEAHRMPRESQEGKQFIGSHI
jgi:hypothetical protein